MDLFLHYKAMVVRSIGLLALVFTWLTSYAQYSLSSNSTNTGISLACVNSSVEEVLLKIEKQAAIHFIYSPPLVKACKPVSLAVNQQSLDNVLALLRKATNLSFRREGDHVVVKKIPGDAVAANMQSPKGVPDQPAKTGLIVRKDEMQAKAVDDLPGKEYRQEKNFSLGKILPVEPLWRQTELSLRDTVLFAKYKLALHTATNTNDLQQKWFVSISILANDFSMSTLEGKLGHRYIYAVIDGSLLTSRSPLVSYGVGTSVSITKKFSVAPVYLYAQTAHTEDYSVIHGFNFLTIKNGYRENIQRHQVKLVLQYKSASRLGWQAGMVYNISQTTTSLTTPVYSSVSIYSDIPYGTSRPPLAPTLSTIKSTASASWIGFEFGINYRIDIAK